MRGTVSSEHAWSGNGARRPGRAASVAALCGLLFASWGPRASAQGSSTFGPLGLEEVLASTASHFPVIEAARQDAEAARMELLAAEGGFDPELKARATAFPFGPYPYTRLETTLQQPTPFHGATAFGGWRRGDGKIPDYYGNLETLSLGELRAGVTVPLWRNGPVDRRRATLERAQLGRTAAELSVQQAALESSRQAAHRYWDWVAAGRRRAVAVELLEFARARDTQLARRVRSGDLAAFELTDNQRALAQRESQVVAAERLLTQAALELSLFLRDADGSPVPVPPERLPAGFPALDAPLPVPESLGDVLARRPDVSRLEAQAAQQRVEARFAANQQAPLIDVTVAAAQDLGSGPDRLRKTELEVGVVLDVPLLNRVARGRDGSTRASVARVEAQLRLQRERAAVEVGDARAALDAARARVLLARKEAAAALELALGERKRLTQGDSSLLIVNLREQTAAEAQVREVDALAEYFKVAATLRAALALPVAVAATSGR
ncbi:TolC family protein [Corallococcus sicarius]|uniref:TolC family protein n=1 Tax=Corallococcus sicarius TaxID=2316726 RepID=A0A3A8NR56_9BACT|nr:TolC family protein [Corallococcus sicarius]RKH46837.1 TolC family protein [Corallococcus sicarius]